MGEGGDARWTSELVGEVSLIVSNWMVSKKVGNWGGAEYEVAV